MKAGQLPNGGQDSKLEDQSFLEHQPHHGLVHALKMNLNHLGISSWEPMSETVVMVPVSSVPMLSSTENDFSSDATVTESLLDPVVSDIEKNSEQVEEKTEAKDSSLQAVSAGVCSDDCFTKAATEVGAEKVVAICTVCGAKRIGRESTRFRK